MTQQYYDPNQGQYPPQGYNGQPQGPYQQPGYTPQHQPAPPNYGVPQGYGQPQQPPAPQGAQGSLDDFFGQPTTGGGKGISWKGVPDGYTLHLVVARPITDGDVFQESDPHTKALRFWRDGRPKFALQVPIKFLVPVPTHPDGDGRLFLRGQLQEEVSRAMAEAGASGTVPESGAYLRVTLAYRKPGNNIAQNIFQVLYRSPGTWENDPSLLQQQYAAPAQATPNPQQAPQQYGGAPQGPYQQTPSPQQYAQPASLPQGQGTPQYGGQAYAPNPQAAPAAPQQGTLPGMPDPNLQQQPPQGQPPVQPGVQPSGLPPAQQALVERMKGNAQPAPQG